MVENYFDAHLYITNWGTHRLMLRLPNQALPPRTVQPYCLDHRIETWTTRTHLLLDLTSEDEDGDWIEGADDSLAALIGVRDELATGDLRPLYLAWLSALAAWELEDDGEEEYQTASEPPVPPGLGELTAPQRALADFLRVDADLLTIAAEASPAAPQSPVRPTKKELTPLIAALPEKEKDALLLEAALGTAPQPGPAPPGPPPRRVPRRGRTVHRHPAPLSRRAPRRRPRGAHRAHTAAGTGPRPGPPGRTSGPREPPGPPGRERRASLAGRRPPDRDGNSPAPMTPPSPC